MMGAEITCRILGLWVVNKYRSDEAMTLTQKMEEEIVSDRW